MSKFDKWNEKFGGEKGLEALEEAKKNEFADVPNGIYEVKIEKMELDESKDGKPMLKVQFSILSGKYKKQKIFYNQVATAGFPMHKTLEFLRSLEMFDEDEVVFDGNYEALYELITEMSDESSEYSYDLKKSTNSKDYPEYKILKVYDE